MPDLVRCDGSEKQRCVYAGIAVHALTAVPEHVAVVAGAIYTEKRHSEHCVGRAERFGHNANHKLRRHISWRQASSVFLMPAEQSAHRVSMPAFRKIIAACCSPAARVCADNPSW